MVRILFPFLSQGIQLSSLTHSIGNAEGLGETRKKELAKSGVILGLRKPEDVLVIDRPDQFPDSMTETWDSQQIAALLRTAFVPEQPRSHSLSDSSASVVSVDVLITFDAGGVSSHPNHISLYHGARAFVDSLISGKPGWSPPVDLYTLTTISLLRKYAAFLDLPATLLSWALSAEKKDKEHPGRLVFLNGLAGHGGVMTAWKAMTSAHKSQMVWFRYGWITLSRYMYINDLRLVKSRGQ